MQTSLREAPDNTGIRLDDPKYVGSVGSAKAAAEPLLFVTGASRSGTTMLARILGEHSDIMAFNELHYFGSLWDPDNTDRRFTSAELSELAAMLLARQDRGLWGGGQPSQIEYACGRRIVRDMPNSDCTPATLYATVAGRLAKDAGKRFACEQTPRNIFYARQLLALYPKAKVLHIVRDPRAVLASQKNRWKMRRLGADHLPIFEMLRNRVNYHAITMGQLWRKASEQAWQLRDHPRFAVIRFENLATDPDSSVRQICDFLGVQFEPAMLEIPRWGSSNVEHSNDQKGIATEVVEQWRNTLSKGELMICEKITQSMMQRFGYSPEFLDHQAKIVTVPSLLSYPLHVAGVICLNPGRAITQLRAMSRSGKKTLTSPA